MIRQTMELDTDHSISRKQSKTNHQLRRNILDVLNNTQKDFGATIAMKHKFQLEQLNLTWNK